LARKRAVEASSGRLRGKVALIFGATRGIGLATARALAAEGCDLFLGGRDRAALGKASREVTGMGVRVYAKTCDVRREQSVNALVAEVRRRFGQVDILFNNAGIAHANRNVERLPVATWRDVLETNLTGMFLGTRASLPLMKRGGTIVNNLSVAAKRVWPGTAAYNASKHGALGLTNTLREELRPRGIRVLGLIPGATDTDIWDKMWPQAPRQRMISPETVASILIGSLLLPDGATVEELRIGPTGGAL